MMLKLVFLLILCGCLGFVYNQCPTCPYQNSPGGYNSPCSNGYLTPWCSQGTCYNNYCQYLPCYYNTYKNHPYGLNNIGIANKQLPFIQFTNNGNKFTNKPNNDPFGNAELEIIDHNSAPTTTGQIQQQQQYPNYQQFFHNTMNFNQDPFANIPAEIIDEDELEEHGIDPKMVTSSHSSYSVNGGQQSVVTQQKTQPISTTFTRSFTPQERVRFDENFVDGTKINETTTTEIVTETSVVTTTEDDEPAAVNSWLI